jgi:hypothetical protein
MRFVWPKAMSGFIAAAFVVCASTAAYAAPPAPPAPAPVAAPGQRISGPYTSENMSVYLIHGKNSIKNNANILTLEEALARKAVKVHETSDVNNLSIENLSNSVVFLQSGDIVRGGKQDRALQYDMLLQPKSGKVSLPAFCVEQGRWQGRGGGESSSGFASSSNSLPSKELRFAAKHEGQQQSVWNGVANAQSKLAAKMKSSSKDARSESSLELSMEKTNVKAAASKHITKLAGVCNDKEDVIGYAVAINGKLENADVYASNALFKKLWPKLLKASSIEAVSEKDEKVVPKPPAAPEVLDFLKDTKAAEKQKIADKNYQMSEQESSGKFQYKTRAMPSPIMVPMVIDGREPNTVIHQNIMAK